MTAVAESAGCLLLADLNNFFVNQVNHGVDAITEIKKLPSNRIREIHLAGGEYREDLLIDTHSQPVNVDVWDLYQQILNLWGPIATTIYLIGKFLNAGERKPHNIYCHMFLPTQEKDRVS